MKSTLNFRQKLSEYDFIKKLRELEERTKMHFPHGRITKDKADKYLGHSAELTLVAEHNGYYTKGIIKRLDNIKNRCWRCLGKGLGSNDK